MQAREFWDLSPGDQIKFVNDLPGENVLLIIDKVHKQGEYEGYTYRAIAIAGDDIGTTFIASVPIYWTLVSKYEDGQ